MVLEQRPSSGASALGDPSDAPWLTTERVLLRRPTADDLDDYVRLHSDPRTYAHAPTSMPTPARCRERLSDDLADWERDERGMPPSSIARLAR